MKDRRGQTFRVLDSKTKETTMTYRQQLERLPREWTLPVHPDFEGDEEQCRRRLGLYRALVMPTEEPCEGSFWNIASHCPPEATYARS